MLSRVADSIYWMCRYIERAENYSRFMDVNLSLIMDMRGDIAEQWEPLVRITGDNALFVSLYNDRYARDEVIEFLTFDQNNPNAILSCITQARENARTVREIISSEMWQQINELYLSVREFGNVGEEALSEYYRKIKKGAHLFNGTMDATLTHNEAYHFANTGRLIERADKTDRILDMKYFYLLPRVEDVGSPLDYLQWSALLRSTSAYEMYRKKYGKLEYRNIINLLLFDQDFPRAVRFSLQEADHSLHTISGAPSGTFANAAEKEMGKLISRLSFDDTEDVITFGLHEYLDNLQVAMNSVSREIFNVFFSRSQLLEQKKI